MPPVFAELELRIAGSHENAWLSLLLESMQESRMLWPLETAAGRGNNRGSTMKPLFNVRAGSAGGGGRTPPRDRAIPRGEGVSEKPLPPLVACAMLLCPDSLPARCSPQSRLTGHSKQPNVEAKPFQQSQESTTSTPMQHISQTSVSLGPQTCDASASQRTAPGKQGRNSKP